MITRIRNSNAIRASFVRVNRTKLAINITKVLKEEGFIELNDSFFSLNSKDFLIALKYKAVNHRPYITNIVRISVPGQRVYCKTADIPVVLGGMGVAVCLNFGF